MNCTSDEAKTKQCVIFVDNNGLKVTVLDQAHVYSVKVGTEFVTVGFQKGPVPEVGVNGLTMECLLTIMINRTIVLDNMFPCDENKLAIMRMREALAQLELRTAKRNARGVEGKLVV